MVKVNVLRVFTDENDRFGDVATIIIDEDNKISVSQREKLAKELDTGETVFINRIANNEVSIVHSHGEIDFAGVAALGAARLLADIKNENIDALKTRASNIVVSHSDEVLWVQTNLSTMPEWHHEQLENAEAVEAIALEETREWQPTMVWAWLNKEKGLIRARTFATPWNIPEAQGNGSGSMMLAAIVGREIKIIHGEGSVIFARPVDNNAAEIGGKVVIEKSKTIKI